MKYTKDKIKTLNIRLEADLKERYYKFLKDNGFSMAKRIRILLENDMKK
jgi:antitoxin component of RelBE/YafQ-DinJ toxin-antitoxin module